MSGRSETLKFQLVSKRKRHGRRQNLDHLLDPSKKSAPPEINIDQLLRKISNAVKSIQNSPYKKILHNGLENSLNTLNIDVIPVIVCYGLGNFSENKCAQYQLAALLIMQSRYESQVHLYDPVFYPQEIEVLKKLGLTMIETNEVGKRKTGDKLTLFYMPHCFKGLVANVIYANWGIELNNCILLTNSFNEIVDDVVLDDQEVKDSVELIKKIHPFTTEFVLEENFDNAPDAFHCTSIHVFSMDKLSKVPDDFWAPLVAPPFNQNEIDHERRKD